MRCGGPIRASARATWQIADAGRAFFQHGQPIFSAHDTPKDNGILVFIELHVKAVSWRYRRETNRDYQTTFGIEFDDHDGIVPP